MVIRVAACCLAFAIMMTAALAVISHARPPKAKEKQTVPVADLTDAPNQLQASAEEEPQLLKVISSIRDEDDIDLFQGSSLQNLNPGEDGEFNDALRQVAAEASQREVPLPEAVTWRPKKNPTREESIRLAEGSAPDTAAYVAKLRETARLLEEWADQFETSSQYDRADQLRNLASQLRLEARRAVD